MERFPVGVGVGLAAPMHSWKDTDNVISDLNEETIELL